MNKELPDTKQKALKINLDKTIYGTFAEIGAGQEVVRHFFQVGGASKTIAKSMSAYDMTVSDRIYGVAAEGRYVSRSRAMQMINYEYKLLTERLTSEEYKDIKFFSFANTVATTNYSSNESHAWVSLKFQLRPRSKPNYIVCHVKLLNASAAFQKKIVGILGVNLIYAVYYFNNNHQLMVRSLADDLSQGSIEVDTIEISGPDFSSVDSKKLNLYSMALGYSSATLFTSDNEILQPKDYAYKKNISILISPLKKRFPSKKQINTVLDKIIEEKPYGKKDMHLIVNTTFRKNTWVDTPSYDISDFYKRCKKGLDQKYSVLASIFSLDAGLIKYFSKCKPADFNIIINYDCFIEILNNLDEISTRKILGYLGDVFREKLTIYTYGHKGGKSNTQLRSGYEILFNYLVSIGYIKNI